MIFIFRFWALLVCLTGVSSLAAATEVNTAISDIEQIRGIKTRYQLHSGTGIVRFIDAEEGRPLFVKPDKGASAEVTARSFISRHGKVFGIAGENELTTRRITRDDRGNTFARLQQHQGGLPVIVGEIVIHTDGDNNVKSVFSRTTPKRVTETTPKIPPEKALTSAVAVTAKRYKLAISDLTASAPELSIYDPALLDSTAASRAVLVWKIEVTPKQLQPIRQLVLVDAVNGRIALTFNQSPHAKSRVVYDKNNVASSLVLPGTLAELKRSEGNAVTGISDVDNAYDYSGDTYDFYLTTHGRDSIDDDGMPLVSTVRYRDPAVADQPFQNAFWNGHQMVYGEGFSRAEDVVGHELTHGVTEKTSGLAYYMQSGAINESLSDVWGEFIQQTYHPPTAANKWLIGEDLPDGVASRSMKDPGWTDASGKSHHDPDRMTSSNYACGYDDDGGVHSNSGINNKAAFLMTDGGSFNGKSVTGLGITKVAKIYYYAQTNLLTSGSDYGDLYNALQVACTNLIDNSGITTADCQQVKNATDAVEMNKQPTSCAAPEAPICNSSTPVDLFFDNLESSSDKWIMSDATVWSRETGYARSGINSLYGEDSDSASDTNISMKSAVAIPANAYLRFDHVFEFESDTSGNYDGGVVEYITDGGNTWSDAGTLFTHNGYNKTLISGSGNVLGGHQAFGDISNGYISSRLNLATLSGTNAKFRFRIATDNYVGYMGWRIDNVRIYTCPNDATAPGAPTIGTATPGNAYASVSFTAPASNGGSAITSYTVTSSPGSITATGSSSPITVTKLTNGTSYTFTVKATNAIGSSPASAASNSVTPLGSEMVPGAPTIGTATAGNASASVSFTPPASNGGIAITGYIVSSSPGNINATGPASPMIITGLTNGTFYTFTVKAINAVGSGPASAASNSVTPLGSITVPGAPSIGMATAGNASASVSFAAPASSGGSDILNYTVTSLPGNFSATGASSPITVTGLINGISYTFTVKATNAAGNSTSSAQSNGVTPGVLSINYTVTPGTTANVTVSPATIQAVAQGGTTTFTIVPDSGYGVIAAGCGGTLVGTNYTTGHISQNCSLTISGINRSGTKGTTPGLIDAVNVFRAVNNVATLTAEDKIRYDVAPLGPAGTPIGDGVLDITDVILILRRSIGLFNW
jgi:bacillolysin